MNCADCGTPHNGIEGLMPRKAGRVEHVNVQAWDMICAGCLAKRRNRIPIDDTTLSRRERAREPGSDDDLGETM